MIEKEFYIEQSRGFEVEDRQNQVCKLKKALYGLKQAPRAWYGRIDSLGFAKSKVDPNISYKVVENVPVILLLHVDDLFLTGNEKQIMESKKKLAEEFEMKDLGLMHYFLGQGVWKRSEGIFINQGKYRDIEEIQYVGMQSHGHTHGLQNKAVS